MKTSELIGLALDWAVAKCEGLIRPDGGVYCGHHGNIHKFKPSTDWSQGGPIIEREKINIEQLEHYCVAYIRPCEISQRLTGPTPLIAAMRCYVASKLGDEVEIPEELA